MDLAYRFFNWTVINGTGHFMQHGMMNGTYDSPCDTLVVVDTEEQVELYVYTPLEKIVNTYILPVIMAVGLLTNIAFLFVVARVHRMRTVVNVYLVSLAFADILFLGASLRLIRHPFVARRKACSSPLDLAAVGLVVCQELRDFVLPCLGRPSVAIHVLSCMPSQSSERADEWDVASVLNTQKERRDTVSQPGPAPHRTTRRT